jgi:prepilin-type N-terminal cleavage/methylation domain-containing protein/prepilin-type processing-associated H-X9-DG protein
MSRKGRSGFTLIELLVVVVVITVLAAIAFPVTSHVVQSAKASACVSNLKNLGAALNLYLGEHSEIMPVLQAGRKSISENVPVIDNTLNAYVQDQRVFVCPGDSQGIAAASGTSYYWNNALNGQSITNLQFFMSKGLNAEIPVMLDKEGFHPYAANKVNVLYADGHASQDLKFMTSQ